MLAAAPKDIPLREQSHLTIQSSHTDQVPLEDRLCPGCKKSAVNEQGGLVVAFGQSFFHVDCFKCAKCRNQVTADTNLLLLSDGSPICANCSYSCNICRLPILDEAIMTGDDSYHAHCFKCKVCNTRIDELVFAKTSQGIYCMNCHNERMIKIRKHAQKKAERERQANGGSGSSRSRETEARNSHRDQESRSASQKPLNASVSYRRGFSDSSRSPTKHNHDVPVFAFSSQSPPVAVIPALEPDISNHQPPTDERPPQAKSNTLPTPLSAVPSDKTRSDALRSSTIPIKPDTRPSEPGNIAAGNSTLSPQSLSVTSRRDKRRSINPGLTLSLFKDGPAIQNDNHSPVNSTLQSQESRHSPQSPFLTADHFTNKPAPRSRSNSATSSHSRISHPRDDETVVMASPPSLTTDLVETSTKYGSRNSTQSRTSGSLSPIDAQYSTNRSSFTSGSIPSRAASPAHRVDVPQGVDSDTDAENETDYRTSGQLPPPLPPKSLKPSVHTPPLISAQSSVESDASELTTGDADDTGVEQTSHTTFIAPALPPIRFSMNNADFSELLSSLPKSLDGRKKLAEEYQGDRPSTPPPTATSASMPTPRGRNSSARESVSSTTSGREAQVNPVLSFTPPPDDTASESNVSVEQSTETSRTQSLRQLESESVLGQLREAINSAKEKGARQLQVDINFVDAVIDLIESRDASFNKMKTKVDGMNRESKRFIAGLTVAQAEYDQELKARRDAEAEVTRLRVLLSGQAVRLAALSGDNKKQELRQQLSKELHDNLSGLEQDLSRLKVERDMTLAEFEELSAKLTNGVPSDISPANLSRSLTKRLESIRCLYQSELIPLTEQKEALCREIAELKSVRDMFLEETTVLNARNEELAQLSAVYARRIEIGSDLLSKTVPDVAPRPSADSFRQQTGLIVPSLSSSTSGSSTVYDEGSESRHMRTMTSQYEFSTPMKGKFKWPGSKPKETASPMSHSEHVKKAPHIEHNFQQLSVLRFARCDHCGDKMWGSQLRCTACATSIHVRCITHVQMPCTQNHRTNKDEPEMLSPSMFGRNLTEQVRADSRDVERQVPVLVEKCIQAVETRALDYEGIYRKTGGSSQSKAITQLFERGDYDSFDLCDADRFTDVCSITSVLKTYFRSLPIPLLTFDLHDQFVQAVSIRDPVVKERTLTEIINSMPNEHYYTLRMLMTHLNHVSLRCDLNLMTSRNLGVVFGPTLMRSRDPGAEFSDMAGKALFIEWLVENAPLVFQSLDG